VISFVATFKTWIFYLKIRITTCNRLFVDCFNSIPTKNRQYCYFCYTISFQYFCE